MSLMVAMLCTSCTGGIGVTTEKISDEGQLWVDQCEEVTDYPKNIGTIRSIKLTDIDTLVDWGCDYASDIEDNVNKDEVRHSLLNKVDKDILFVLVVNNELVSMAQRSRSLNKTESVGYVYTHKKHRRKGYASIMVSYVTKRVLQGGKIATIYWLIKSNI